MDVPALVDTAPPRAPDDAPVSVTVVTGFLGSGKSTLLRHLVRQTGKRIAIIVNEFGSTADIERSISVASGEHQVEEWVELDNGCICCSAKDAGVVAIEKLMERRGRFDHILLETTGVADPGPIASMFWLDDALAAHIQIDGVVAVVDAGNVARTLEDEPAMAVQIATADVVLLNKCDTVDDAGVARAEAVVRASNGACAIHRCSFGAVDPASVLDLHSYGADRVALPAAPSASHAPDPRPVVPHSVSTVVVPLTIGSDADLDVVEARLQHLFWEKELDGSPIIVYRAKGRLAGPGISKILQSVRETYELVEVPHEPDAESKLVLIGKGVAENRDKILAYFES